MSLLLLLPVALPVGGALLALFPFPAADVVEVEDEVEGGVAMSGSRNDNKSSGSISPNCNYKIQLHFMLIIYCTDTYR